MKKYIRISSIIIALLTFAGSAVFSMTSCSGEKPNETSVTETTEMSVEETTEELTTEISYDVTEYIDPELYYEPEEIDYSDFGFLNNYGMNEWMSISGYSIGDIDDSYVYNCNEKFVFNDSFFKTFLIYNDDAELDNTAKCSIEDNDTITFTTGDYSGTTMMITDRKMSHSIPIMVVECNESYWGHKIVDGTWFIPTDLIDWSRSPEKGTHTTEDGETKKVTKYYIDESFIH